MGQEDNNSIGRLDEIIGRAINRYVELRKQYSLIVEEKKELEALCSEQENRIEGLQKHIEELQKDRNHETLKRYQQNEVQIKQRIQSMLSRLNDLDQLDQS